MKFLVLQVCELGRILRHLYSSVVMLEESSELCIVSEMPSEIGLHKSAVS